MNLSTSLMRPAGFYIIGFTSLPFSSVYLCTLCVFYVLTAVLNSSVIAAVFVEPRLHTPKYMAVANLALIDVGLSTTIIPGMLRMFLLKDNFLTFNICLTQMFFYYMFITLESYSLAVLSYDRFIAICFPLRQHTINTVTNMLFILVGVWIYGLTVIVTSTVSLTWLSFCGPNRVYSYFCDFAPTFRLACSDYTLQWLLGSVLSMLNSFLPLSLILASYVCILVAVFRMKKVESRLKALATCTEHLILVAVFYAPILVLYIIGFFLFGVDPDIRMVNLSLSTSVPPLMNPVVYTLRTKEIRARIAVAFKNIKVKPTA